ncbi:GNAT family N-acetyltransferase [uncultured Shewanella sp.]|uniref:GNAT family N-acetyltransferase n=1 Tax=uncultured Shewanella sp. TaxID=173975 RepID=UPI002609C6AD|nr:GNAT family N-acetyltransferase [uncultured Shewanella sp.]
MEEVHIRPAVETDIKAISHLMIELTEKYITFELADDVKGKLLASLSVDSLMEAFNKHWDYFVATIHNQIVGVIGMKDVSHLLHLFVMEAFQGKNIANQLWQVAKNNALTLCPLTCFTVNSAISAQAVYKKWGFRAIDGVRTRNGFSDVPMKLYL